MKTLLFAGVAGVLAIASGSANAAIDSPPDNVVQPLIDLSFASSTVLANPAEGTRTMPRRGHAGRMKSRHNVGSFVRKGRVGYGNGYRKPHRGFRLPGPISNPAISSATSAITD